jgi:outer membrane beta-barrel protein
METHNVRTPFSFGSKSRYLGLTISLALTALPSHAFAQAAPGAEEEEEEGKAAPAAKGTKATPTPPPAAAATAPAAAGTTAKSPQTLGYLEGRADAESPNELISVVQKKTYTAAHKFELTLYPIMIQLNSKFVNTDGIGLAASYAIQENFAIQVLLFWNYVGQWTSITPELLYNKTRPQVSDQMIIQGGAVASFEVAPIYGKFSFYDKSLVQWRFVIGAGAGVGQTAVQLTGPTPGNDLPKTFGSTGLRFMGDIEAGFRLLIGERVAVRLEVRDFLLTTQVNTIDGCTATDIAYVGTNGTAPAGSSCNPANFSGNTHQAGVARSNGQAYLGDNSSSVLNDIMFVGGASLLF